jgi:hypothetical protein
VLVLAGELHIHAQAVRTTHAVFFSSQLRNSRYNAELCSARIQVRATMGLMKRAACRDANSRYAGLVTAVLRGPRAEMLYKRMHPAWLAMYI